MATFPTQASYPMLAGYTSETTSYVPINSDEQVSVMLIDMNLDSTTNPTITSIGPASCTNKIQT